MRWKRRPSEFLPEKTFLVIKDDLQAFKVQTNSRTKKSAGSTDTWPPKMKRGQPLYDETERPKTANLERPSVLDPILVDKLDMSLLSKELLCDSITRFHHGKTILSGGRSPGRCQSIGSKQQSTTWPTAAWRRGASLRQKRRSFEQLADTTVRRIETAPASPVIPKQLRMTSLQENNHQHRKQTLDNRKLDDNNNRDNANGLGKVSTLSPVKRKSCKMKLPSDVRVFVSGTTKSAPEPCKACGRPDQPERFHSHPQGNLMKIKDNANLPKSIQKPVPLNFRSDRNKQKIEPDGERKCKTIDGSTQENQRSSVNSSPHSAPFKKGPKTVTCYICGREFGTASFPIHEPKCKQKWERENNSLPPSQRRPTPRRPNVTDPHEWNAAAWQESQAQLLPCSRCGRTFLPDRLAIHQKSCKAIPKNPDNENSEKGEAGDKKLLSANRNGPPTVKCQICGRNFGTRSIKIHEPQCIKRWHIDTDNATTEQGQRKKESALESKTPVMSNIGEDIGEDVSRKRCVACYICGKNFASNSIAIHESQCLKKWRLENNVLSLTRGRGEAQSKENVSSNGEPGPMILGNDMTEIVWKSHLEQLVPCKHCKRTFNPDRVDIHERSCKGIR